MRRKILLGVVWTFLFGASAFGVPKTEIWYETTELGLGKWQYTYEVTNISLTKPIVEFTIWFDFGSYENLAIETPEPLASDWDEIVVQPEPVLKDDGYYDAKTGVWKRGIGVGQTVSGFAVSFDWLGVGQPGSQFYEIIDPGTFETIDSGMTIPEPTSAVMLGLGGVLLVLRRVRRQA